MKNYATEVVGGVEIGNVPDATHESAVVSGDTITDQDWIDEVFAYYDSMADKVKMISSTAYEYMQVTKRNIMNLFRNLSKYAPGKTFLTMAGVVIVGVLALQLWRGLQKRREAKSELGMNTEMLRKKYNLIVPATIHPKLVNISKILPDNFALLKISRNPLPGMPDSFDVLAVNENLNLKEREQVYTLFNDVKNMCKEYNIEKVLEELLTTRVRGVSNGFDMLKEINFDNTSLADLMDWHTVLRKLEFNPGFLSLADLSALLYIQDKKVERK